MTSEKVHHHVFANPAAESKSAGVLEDEFLTLESLVAIKNTAAARRQKQVLADIEELILKALSSAAAEPKPLEVLRGIEGAGTRIYYSVFANLIRNTAFSFDGRNRRPPLDPVNALLSFAYTLLTNEVLSAVKSAGLDPYLGALHEVEYGRPSLACDLVEEYRAFMADRLVLGLINKQVVSPSDFVYRKPVPAEFTDEAEMKARRPVEMKPAVCRAFIAAYEQMMGRSIMYPPLNKQVSYRWLLLNQVRRFGRYLENPVDRYEPFAWEN